MRFIQISEKRLNVYLSKAEAENEKISINSLVEESYNAKEKLSGIFSRAYESTGFDCENAGLKIEFIPLYDGDLIISILKIDGNKNKVYLKDKTFIFEFESFDNLAFALASTEKYYTGRESVYKYRENYFLILYIHKIKLADVNFLKLFFLEFGNESSVSHLVLREYGRQIVKGEGRRAVRQYLRKG